MDFRKAANHQCIQIILRRGKETGKHCAPVMVEVIDLAGLPVEAEHVSVAEIVAEDNQLMGERQLVLVFCNVFYRRKCFQQGLNGSIALGDAA